MLVLDRKVHEGFWIDNRIFVKVLSIGRHRIKLGIEAPEDLLVVRDELKSQSKLPSQPEGGSSNGRGRSMSKRSSR